jgi:uncharacterized protein YutE (UPF0331/DUF86 family)
MTNPEIIKERLKEIDENLRILSDLSKMPLATFTSDVKAIKIAERCLEISIQCILDICHHIIAENNWPRPKDNQEAIKIIGQKGVIPLSFARKISPMAGLRNILVHEYIKTTLA